MHARHIFVILSVFCSLLLSSCMSQQLVSQSGFYNVELEHTYKAPIDGYWSWGKGNPYTERRSGKLYIAPLDVSLVQEDFPELSERIVEQMHKHLTESMQKTLQQTSNANTTRWELTENEDAADIRIDLAVVKLRTQKPLLHVVSMFIGHFTPRGVSNAIEFISKGNITLEGAIHDQHNGQLIFAFKDSNRASLRFYQKETYQRTGHVDANIRLWAEGIARLCRECALAQSEGQTLQQKVENRSFVDAIRARFH